MRIIKFLIAILVLIITLEIVFFYYFSGDSVENTVPTSLTESKPIPTETVQDAHEPQGALDKHTMDMLSHTTTNGHVFTQVTYQFKGTLHSFITPEVQTNNGLRKGNAFLLKGDESTDTNTMNLFILPSESVQFKIRVVQKIGDQENTISVSDLKVGDEIQVDGIVDLSKPLGENLIDYKITKFNNDEK